MYIHLFTLFIITSETSPARFYLRSKYLPQTLHVHIQIQTRLLKFFPGDALHIYENDGEPLRFGIMTAVCGMFSR